MSPRSLTLIKLLGRFFFFLHRNFVFVSKYEQAGIPRLMFVMNTTVNVLSLLHMHFLVLLRKHFRRLSGADIVG